MQNNSTSKAPMWLQIVRVIVGVLFIFSGLVKANDPSGLAYKMQEFFEVWHMDGFTPYVMFFSITMIIFEIVAGVALLIGYAFRTFSYLLLLLMVFFTFLTAYAVFSGKIKECGCFGDCIPLSAMQSFIKDLILLALIIILVIYRKKIQPLFKGKIGHIIIIGSIVVSYLIQWYALRHLPYVDCLPYKVSNNISEKMQAPEGSTPDKYIIVYTLKNLHNGEIKEMPDSLYISSGIWQDTLNWAMEGDPKTIEIKGNATPPIQDFNISDYTGDSYTDALLTDPGSNFLLFLNNIDKASKENLDRIKALAEKANSGETVGFYVLSSNSEEKTLAFLKEHGIHAQVFMLDGTVSKTAMRSNPGLMLIQGGTIKGKWSYKDYPQDFEIVSPQEIKPK